MTIDLVTKSLAVRDPQLFGDGYLHNPDLPSAASRVLVCVGTIGFVALLSHLLAARGAGPIPFTWLAAGLIVGGVLGNWTSSAIWSAGVPDFIDHRGRMWNLADFTIGIGVLMLLTSSFAYPIRAFVRDRRA